MRTKRSHGVVCARVCAAPGFAQARRAAEAGAGEPGRASRPPAQPAPPARRLAAPPPPAPFPRARRSGCEPPAIAQLRLRARRHGEDPGADRKKQKEAAARSKTLQDAQAKLQQGGALMNEAARTQLEKDVERQRSRGSASSRTPRPRSTSSRPSSRTTSRGSCSRFSSRYARRRSSRALSAQE